MKPNRTRQLKGRKVRAHLMASILIAALFLMAPDTHALDFQLGDDAKIDFDTTVIYGLSMRMSDPAREALNGVAKNAGNRTRNFTGINSDDGNRSFEKHELTSNRITIRSDFDFSWKNLGLFARGRAFYDDVYNKSNSNDSPRTHNNGPIMGGPLTDHQSFTEALKDQIGKDAELLDFFAYGNFEVGERPLMIRVGKQVVSWGESLFTLGGISSAQSHADATMLNTPGAELKDIYLPSGQVLSQIEVFQNLTFAGYYQWRWERHRSDPAGAYFNFMDYGDVGGYHLIAVPGLPVTADRIADKEADESGQYGIALRYLAPTLNQTEFGVYFLNYHEKFPMAGTVPGAGKPNRPNWGNPTLNFVDNLGYNLAFQEDIKLYGASFSTQVGPTNVSGEVSYREDYLIQVVDPSPINMLGYKYKPFDVVQVLVSAIHVFGPISFVDSTTLMFEIGMNQVLDPEDLYKDTFAWGSMTSLSFDFFNVLPFWDMKIPVSFKHRPKGVSSLPGTFSEDQQSVSLGAEFTYRSNITFGIKYTEFLGKPDEDPLSDRDYLSFSAKYTF